MAGFHRRVRLLAGAALLAAMVPPAAAQDDPAALRRMIQEEREAFQRTLRAYEQRHLEIELDHRH